MTHGSITRRHLLAGAGSTLAIAGAGCTERLWSRAEDTAPEQVELSIKTVPADDDPMAATIVSQLEGNLRRAGIDATREPMEKAELLREVLVEREFDVFVARHPGMDDADVLRPLVHSQFVGEQGWQNPFGFSDPTIDDLLDEQLRRNGGRRRETVGELLTELHERLPYAAVAFPDRIAARATWLDISEPPLGPIGYTELLWNDPPEEADEEAIRIGVSGREGGFGRLNPIAVDVRDIGEVLDLLYDPLVRPVDGERRLWLADDLEWTDPSSGIEATVTVRNGATWHDGVDLDAEDVAFTYRFLQDTSLGESEAGVPAPQYRGRMTVVDDVDVRDSRTVAVTFSAASQEVAWRTFSIPILPEHIWEPRSTLFGDHRSEAIATDNEEPVGSGLFQFVDAAADGLTLETFGEHVLQREGVPGIPGTFDDEDRLERVEFSVSPTPGAVVEGLIDGTVDLGLAPFGSDALELIDESADVEAMTRPTQSFYLIGFSDRHPALGNPRVRGIISRLIDREFLVEEFFEHAEPARTRSAVVGFRPSTWEGSDSDLQPFVGEDGEIDEEWVRAAFEDIGYRYEDDRLIS